MGLFYYLNPYFRLRVPEFIVFSILDSRIENDYELKATGRAFLAKTRCNR